MIEEGFTGFAIFCLIAVFLFKLANVLKAGDFYEKEYIFLTTTGAGISYFFVFIGQITIRSISFTSYFMFSTLIFILSIMFFIVEILLMFTGKDFRGRLNQATNNFKK